MTIDRSFFPEPEPVSVARIIELGNCFLRKGSPDFTVKDVGALDQAASEFLVFAINKQLIQELKSAHGYALICTHELLEEFGETILSGAEVILVSQNPRYLFAQACSIIYPEQGTNSGSIHPTAQIDKSANIAQDVTIGPFCCIAAGVAIGRGSSLGAGVNCAPSVKIGEDCQIGDYVTLEKTIIDGGSSVGQHSVIGKAGFGFESHENDIQKIPHLGRVIIGRRTSIGAHCCIDRGTIQDTRIADLVMIDNMVHIAHNVQIGRKSIILAQAGIAGSSIIGENCIIGGQAGIADHVKIVSGTVILSRSGVTKSITTADVYAGFPAIIAKNYWREQAQLRRLAKPKKKMKDKIMSEIFEMDYRDIEAAIPHRPPFLLIDKVTDIVVGQSAVGIKAVSGGEPYFAGHFPGNPVMPGVLIIEAFAQVASCMFVRAMPGETEGKLFFLTTVDKAKFRNPVRPGDMLYLKIERTGGKGPLQKFKGVAEVNGVKMAEAELSAMVVSASQ